MTAGIFEVASAPLTSTQLVDMLRGHYLPPNRPPGVIFATEIEAPTGSRRADVLVAPLTTYAGSGLIGHEIKVTRSDILRELDDVTKVDPWARHCARWWLVVADPLLIAGLTIPDAWGIMAPPSGRRKRSMTVIRQAPKLNPANDGPGWHRLAAWQYHRLAMRLETAERDRDRYKATVDDYVEARERGELQRFGREAEHAERIGAILKALEAGRGKLGVDVYVGREDVSDDDVVAALLDLGAIRSLTDQLRDELRWRLAELRRITEPIDAVAKALETHASKPKPIRL